MRKLFHTASYITNRKDGNVKVKFVLLMSLCLFQGGLVKAQCEMYANVTQLSLDTPTATNNVTAQDTWTIRGTGNGPMNYTGTWLRGHPGPTNVVYNASMVPV